MLWLPPFFKTCLLLIAGNARYCSLMSAMEVQETTDEIITVLSNAEDEEMLEKVAQVFDKVNETRLHEEDNTNNTLLQLRKLLTEQEEKIKSLKLEESSNQMDSLQAEKKTATQFIEKLQGDVNAFEANIAEKEHEIKELKVRAAEEKENLEEMLPQKKYIFNLYTNVSHIRWDYECEGDQVKGFMATLSDVKPFCLSKSEKSSFEIANCLWDLMDD